MGFKKSFQSPSFSSNNSKEGRVRKEKKLKHSLNSNFEELFPCGLENVMPGFVKELENFKSKYLDKLLSLNNANDSQNGGLLFLLILIVVLHKRYNLQIVSHSECEKEREATIRFLD